MNAELQKLIEYLKKAGYTESKALTQEELEEVMKKVNKMIEKEE